jgi:hypothetical protein
MFVIAEPVDGVPEFSLEFELIADDTEDFDGADEEGDDDGDGGDGHVVIEFSQGVNEGPAISAEHEDSVGSVEQTHAGGEEQGEEENGPDGEALRGGGGGYTEEADLGSGVETEAEEEADTVHFPTMIDESENGAEDSTHDAKLA